MLSKLKTLASEFAFARRLSVGIGSFLALGRQTIRFHLANKLGKERNIAEPPFRFRAKLAGQQRDLWLRATAGDVYILYEVLSGGVYRLEQESSNPGAVRWILDCGGNIGVTTLYFAERYPNARIVVVEPVEENFALLKKNTAGIERIIPVQGCVSDRSGSVYFTTNKAAWGNVISDEPTGYEVRAYTVAELMSIHGIEKLDILKVDIEGAEERLFAAPTFLKRVGLVVIELHGHYDLARFATDIAPEGFVARPADPAAGRPMVTAVPAR